MSAHDNPDWTSTSDPTTAPGGFSINDSEFHALRRLILEQAGITLNDSKKQLVASRLARRLRALGLRTYRQYFERVTREDPDGGEMREMLNCITTNKTDFFRERHHFDFLKSTVFPWIRERSQKGGPRQLRIWSAGCSSGEEPYTLAMTILSGFESRAGWRFEILATDLDTQVLTRAQQGVYANELLRPVPPELRRRLLPARFRRERRPGARQGRAARPHHLPALQPDRAAVADQGSVRPHLLPQRADLLRPGDGEDDRRVLRRAAGGGGLPVPRALGEPAVADAGVRAAARHHLPAARFRRTRGRSRAGRRGRGARPAGRGRAGDARARSRPRPPAGSNRVRRLSGSRRALAEASGRSVAPSPGAISAPNGRRAARIHVTIGGVRASADPVELRTVLGSCVCACLYDPVARVGGINHFMLPDGLADTELPTRYGVNAMEMLINDIAKLGGDRRRLEAKAFGAAHVLVSVGLSPDVPRKNAQFIRDFLEKENIRLVSSRLGGSAPVEVLFHATTGRALVRALGANAAADLAREETHFDLEVRKQLVAPRVDDVVLFDEAA